MKEKFFYLEQKYGVKLLTNNQFGKKGNLYSLYVARKHLGNTYVCCADHLGISGNLINRKTELFAQRKAKELGIDNSLIKMDMSVWKISHYITDAKNCDLESSDEQLETIMGYLHRIHNIDVDVKDDVKIFDNVVEGNKLLEIASLTKGNLKREFSDLIEKVERLYKHIKDDAVKMDYKLVLCHNDVYEPNFIYDIPGRLGICWIELCC